MLCHKMLPFGCGKVMKETFDFYVRYHKTVKCVSHKDNVVLLWLLSVKARWNSSRLLKEDLRKKMKSRGSLFFLFEELFKDS